VAATLGIAPTLSMTGTLNEMIYQLSRSLSKHRQQIQSSSTFILSRATVGYEYHHIEIVI
jgi:uncharacterized membrane protein YoaK (UPF0700 family)